MTEPDQVPHSVDAPVRHDFTKARLTWGWNLIHFNAAEDNKSAKAMFVGRGVENGHEIDLEFQAGVMTFSVSELKYDTNPSDLFECVLVPVPNHNIRQTDFRNTARKESK